MAAPLPRVRREGEGGGVGSVGLARLLGETGLSGIHLSGKPLLVSRLFQQPSP